MSGVDSWSTFASNNATAEGGAVDWAEGQLPRTVNNSARAMMASIRALENDRPWFQFGTGDQGSGSIAVPAVYASSTSFTIAGVDVTSTFEIGRKVRAVGSATGTIYGEITASSFSTNTTVTVRWYWGSLSNEALTVSLSQIPVTGSPWPREGAVVTPEQFGAKNDGTDGTTAWARLATFVNAMGGGTVLCREGSYRTGNPTFTKPVLIKGASMSATRFTTATGGGAFTWTGAVGTTYGGGIEDCQIQSDSASGGVVNVQDMWAWRARNVRFFDGGGSAGTTDCCITLKGASFEASLTELRFETGTSSAITLDTAGGYYPNSSKIELCDFSPHNNGCAIYDKGSVGLRILSNHFEYASTDGGYHVRLVTSQRVTIMSNDFGENGTTAVAHISIESTAKDITILGNTFDVAILDGIKIESTVRGVTISTNAISMESGSGWAINNNGASVVSAAGNTIRILGACSGGIKNANGADSMSISGNVIYGTVSIPAAVGIQVAAGCVWTNVIGNNVQLLTSGIDLEVNNGSPTLVFSGNVAKNNTANVTMPTPASVLGGNTNNIYS